MESDAWDRRYAETEFLWSMGPNQFVRSEALGLSPGRALDLAAGEGRNALWLAEGGWSVTAVDFSRVALEKGEKIARERGVTVDWVAADLMTYVPAPGGFALVLVIYLQLPWSRMEHVLGAAARAVAPGGTLLVVGHDSANLDRGYGGPRDPGVLYTPEQVISVLGDLVIERADSVERVVQTDDGPRTAIDVLVRARRGTGGASF